MADQKRTALDWDDLRFFVELARQRTLSGTARALRVNHATVARRIAQLEETLGHPLFERRADGYLPTPAAEAVLREATRMETAAGAILTQRDAALGISGTVRISATPSIAEQILTPLLAPWRRAHPGITIELLAESRTVSLARRDADIALRLARPRSGEAVTRRLATIGYGLYGSPAYLDRTGIAPEDWDYCGFDEDSASLPEARWLDQHVASNRITWRSSSLASQLSAASGGGGVALLPHYLAIPAGLRLCGETGTVLKRELWLVMPSEIRRIARMRMVADAIIAAFATWAFAES